MHSGFGFLICFHLDEFHPYSAIFSCMICCLLIGSAGKQILVSICQKYPNESRLAIYSFLKVGSIPFFHLFP